MQAGLELTTILGVDPRHEVVDSDVRPGFEVEEAPEVVACLDRAGL